MCTPIRSRIFRRIRTDAVWILLAALAALGGSSAAEAAGSAGLVVKTAHPGYRVWVDERYLGTTPLRADSLEPGRRQVEIGVPDSSSAWVRPWKETAYLLPGETDTLALGPLGFLHLQSIPSAVLQANGRESGRTPAALLVPLETGISITLAAPGYRTSSWTYEARGCPDSTVSLTLEPLADASALRPASAPAGAWERRARLLLPAAAVLAGSAGAWARMTADHAYDDYRSTLDRSEMPRKLDRSRSYDRLAVGLWIGAEACLVSAAWLWLRAGSEVPLAASVTPDGTARIGLSFGSGPAVSSAGAAEGRGR